MTARLVIGVVLCFVGALWIAQGVGAAKGSPMTGHSGYAALGAIVVVAGVGFIVWGLRLRRGTPSDRP